MDYYYPSKKKIDKKIYQQNISKYGFASYQIINVWFNEKAPNKTECFIAKKTLKYWSNRIII